MPARNARSKGMLGKQNAKKRKEAGRQGAAGERLPEPMQIDSQGLVSPGEPLYAPRLYRVAFDALTVVYV